MQGAFIMPFGRLNYVINVIVRNNGITISGHAGYAPLGQDIVCSAMSILVYTLQESLNKYTGDAVGFDYTDSGVNICCSQLSAEGRLIVSSFIIGVELLAAAYPDYVNLTKH